MILLRATTALLATCIFLTTTTASSEEEEQTPKSLLVKFLANHERLWDKDRYHPEYVSTVQAQLQLEKEIKEETDKLRELLPDSLALKAKIAVNMLPCITEDYIDHLASEKMDEKISHLLAYFDELLLIQSFLVALNLQIDATDYCYMTGIELEKLTRFLLNLHKTETRKKELAVLKETHKLLSSTLGGAKAISQFKPTKEESLFGYDK